MISKAKLVLDTIIPIVIIIEIQLKRESTKINNKVE